MDFIPCEIDHLVTFIAKLGKAKDTFRYFNKRSPEVIKSHLLTLFGVVDGERCSYGHLEWDPSCRCVWLGICVLPDFQGKGFGKMMMKELIGRAKALCVMDLALTVDKGNSVAMALYEKMGFKREKENESNFLYKMNPSLGLKFHGQWGPKVDEVLLRNYFQGKRFGTWIEAGAAVGGVGSNCLFFEEHLSWNGLNVEPSPRVFRLLKNYRILKSSTNVNVALSLSNGVQKFKDISEECTLGSENGSLCHSSFHMSELELYKCKFEEYDVKTVDYETLLSENNFSKIDLLSLDVEGEEIRVLQGMSACDDQTLPKVMCIEYPYLDFKELLEVTSRLGYQYDFVSFNNAFFSKPGPKPNDWFGSTKRMEWDKANKRWIIHVPGEKT